MLRRLVTSKKPLVIVPVVLALVLAGLFLPVEVSIEPYGRLSLESKITISIGYEVAYASPGWVSPTGFVDSGNVWTDETLAYDEDTGTYAYADALKGDWTDYLELTHATLNCDKVQLWVYNAIVNINAIEVDVYYSSDWHNIFSGAPTWGAWQEHTIGSTQSITALRVRFYSTKAGAGACRIHEADFNEVSLVPDISNLPISKNFGTVTTSTSYWSNDSAPTFPLDDTECYFTVTNSSSSAVNIAIRATDFTGGTPGWTLAGTPAGDTVTLKAGVSGTTDEGAMVTLALPDYDYTNFISNLLGLPDAPNNTKKWELKMETPISFSNGDEKTATITLTATF